MDCQILNNNFNSKKEVERHLKNLPRLHATHEDSFHNIRVNPKSPCLESKDNVFNHTAIRFKHRTHKDRNYRNKRRSALPRTVTSIKEDRQKIRTRKGSLGYESSTEECALTRPTKQDTHEPSIHRPKVKAWSNKVEMREGVLTASPCCKEVNMSTTLNSSLYSAFKTTDDVCEHVQPDSSRWTDLMRRVELVEKTNKALLNEVSTWKERYADLKNQRETVKMQVIEDIKEQISTLQTSQIFKEHETLKLQFKKLEEDYKAKMSEKLEYFEKLNTTLLELQEAKRQKSELFDAYEKKEKLMQVALTNTLKRKLSEPIVRYLLSSVYKNPFGLSKYFENKNHRVVEFLNYCLRRYECGIAAQHDGY